MPKLLPSNSQVAGISGLGAAPSGVDPTQDFRALVQGVCAHAIFMLDQHGKVMTWNTGAARITGYTDGEVVGSHVSSLLSEEDREAGVIERALATALREGAFAGACALLRKDAGRIIADLAIDAIRGDRGFCRGFAVVARDVTRQREDAEQTARMMRFDAMTGVANRNCFMEKLEEACARLRRHGEPFSVFMLDLDRFKAVNDLLGHPAGDALLAMAAQRLTSSLRETDVLGRIGGDEFAIIQAGEANQQYAAATLASRVIDILARPFDLDGNQVTIGVSVGIALAPGDAADPAELVKKADIALYRMKSEGRDDYRFFDPDMTASAEARRQLENDLRGALARDEIKLHYQPVVDAATGIPCAVEALARWNHASRGYVEPSQFIPLAEETGLMVALGERVLQQACAAATSFPPYVKVAINLSPLQLRRSNILDVIMCVLVETGLPANRLELEITEAASVVNKAERLNVMRKLKNLGVAFALDDFGTGSSSLSQLTTFPFDKIKIDASLTQNLAGRADCAAMVSAIVALAAGLGIKTVAEGVESHQQLELVRAAGVDHVQGYLIGRPSAAAALDFDDIARRHRRAAAA